MKLEILSDADSVTSRAAAFIAQRVRSTQAPFRMAVSGGSTPWVMLRQLAALDFPREKLHLYQVDERVAPPGHADRNLTHLRECVGDLQIHPMPVELADLDLAAKQYAQLLETHCGSPVVLDLVHLGLGGDGHTASLVPNDPVLEVIDRPVAITGEYMGRRRMTLTYPVLNHAREILWLATGAGKAEVLKRLVQGDPSIPAGRVAQAQAIVFADASAGVLLS
jgi:6-phosphogluconolactonase